MQKSNPIFLPELARPGICTGSYRGAARSWLPHGTAEAGYKFCKTSYVKAFGKGVAETDCAQRFALCHSLTLQFTESCLFPSPVPVGLGERGIRQMSFCLALHPFAPRSRASLCARDHVANCLGASGGKAHQKRVQKSPEVTWGGQTASFLRSIGPSLLSMGCGGAGAL